jgi:hypothetical protein
MRSRPEYRRPDPARGEMSVRRTLIRQKDGSRSFGPTKTAAGRRLVALPPSCVAALRAHRDRAV